MEEQAPLNRTTNLYWYSLLNDGRSRRRRGVQMARRWAIAVDHHITDTVIGVADVVHSLAD